MTPMILLDDGRLCCAGCFRSELRPSAYILARDEDCDLCPTRDGNRLAETTFRRYNPPAHPAGFRPIGGGR